MNLRLFFAGNLLLVLLSAWPLRAADNMAQFNSKPGHNKVKIEGTSTIHDWEVEGTMIGGHIEVGSGFPAEPGQEVKPGKVDARVEAFIPVRSLHSVKDGKPYSDKMNETMYDNMKESSHRMIYFY